MIRHLFLGPGVDLGLIMPSTNDYREWSETLILIMQVMQRPGTSLVTAICCGVWGFLRSRGLGYAEVGLNYEKVIQQKEYWRIATSQLSHVELLHLVFNISALWSFGFLEEVSGPHQGTVYYIQTSVLLLVLSGLVSSQSSLSALICSTAGRSISATLVVNQPATRSWLGWAPTVGFSTACLLLVYNFPLHVCRPMSWHEQRIWASASVNFIIGRPEGPWTTIVKK